MNQTQQRIQIIRDLGKKYKSRCYICQAPDSQWRKRKGFTFHHKTYVLGEKIHRDFPREIAGRLAYIKYLAPIIRKYPKRFLYLCNKCHYVLTKFYIQYSACIFRRMCQARKMSR